MANTVVPLLVIAGGGVAVYAGITNPEGGVFAGLGSLMRGEPVRKAAVNTAGFVSTAVDLSNVTGGSGGGGNTIPTAATGGGSQKRERVLAESARWLGVPYRWAGTTKAGVDCSGLTMAVYKTVGVKLPHLSAAQQSLGARRALAAARPGDLVFFGFPAHHVGIYLGGNKIRHAPKPGAQVRDERIWRGERITVRDVLSGAKRKATAAT